MLFSLASLYPSLCHSSFELCKIADTLSVCGCAEPLPAMTSKHTVAVLLFLSELLSALMRGWTSQIFKDSDNAEDALCADRAGLVKHDEIRALIPRRIWTHIIHSESSAQIKGVEDLFIHLNTDLNADGLRRLINDYFANSPPLSAHLRKFVLFNQMLCILSFPIAQEILTSHHLHSPIRDSLLSRYAFGNAVGAQAHCSNFPSSLNRCMPTVTSVWKKSRLFPELLSGLTPRRRRSACPTPASRSLIRSNRV